MWCLTKDQNPCCPLGLKSEAISVRFGLVAMIILDYRHRVHLMLFHQILKGITKCRKDVIKAMVRKSGRNTLIVGVDYANWRVAKVPKLSHNPQPGSFWQPRSATRRFSRFFAQESTMHTFVWWWHGWCHWCGWFLGVLFDVCFLSKYILYYTPWHNMARRHAIRPWLTANIICQKNVRS